MNHCDCRQGREECTCGGQQIDTGPSLYERFTGRLKRALGKAPELGMPFDASAAPVQGDIYAQFGTGLAKDNSSLEFEVALAAYHQAVWGAAECEEARIAFDEAGLPEAKVLIGMFRKAATPVVDQDEFEADYADYTGRDIENIRAQRLPGNTYGQPKIANAWRWYQRGKGVPL